MKFKISSLLREKITEMGIRPETVITIQEWEMVISLLDKKFWLIPDADHQGRVQWSTACAQAERIADKLIKEYLNAYEKEYLAKAGY